MRYMLSRGIKSRRLSWLQSIITATMVVIVLGALSAALAATTLPPDAEYSRPRLAQGSQGYVFGSTFTWSNVVPNALASYYTYVPFKNADAVALGFPSTCGNKSLSVTPGDADDLSTEDCYVITAKRFPQQLALPAIFGGGAGLKDEFGAYFAPASYTDVYGYGSGGANWTPPQFVNNGTPTAPNIQPVATPVAVTGNAPAPFTNGTFGTTGIWHFPAPSIKGTKGRPIRVQWLNELPNTIIPGHDPTVDCSDNALNCFPYNRMVVHVHGAHVGPASDGLAHASFNPNFSNLGTKFNQSVLANTAGPPGTYLYPMDQESSTIWYHDHAVGATHTNTNQGLAGFFPITDDNEKCLQGIGTGCTTKYLPTGNYELGLALQDRIFYTDGKFAMPDAPVIDAFFPTCNPATPASRLSTCSPLFMYASHAADAASLTPAGVHLVPYNAGTMEAIPENTQAPVLATSATLEFFGNMPVVNGVVYGKYDVEPRIYRIRFLGGTDSRTWVLQLQRRDNNAIIPLWMIGSEQGLLNNPISMTEAHLMPGERLDFLVDFTGIPVGTKIVLNNLGPDTPFQGEPLTAMVRSVDIPEIMEFNTIAINGTEDTATPSAATSLHPLPLVSPVIVPLTPTAGVPVRVIALEEIVDQYGRVMPTIDRRGYDLPLTPATEIVQVGNTEIWDIINTSADAHTMHLHQVKFQVVHRQVYDTFTPAVNDTVNGIFTSPSYTATANPTVPPDARDAGWKDTDEMIPGQVTRIIATFDLVGEYVWHCHILSHEEHDMMRPMIIAATAAPAPLGLSVPATSAAMTAPVAITAPATPPVPLSYIVEFKLLADTTWKTNISTGLNPTVTFPSGGVYQLRVKSIDAALTPTYAHSAYVAGSNTITVTGPSAMISPANGTILAGNSETFTWTNTGASLYSLWIGTTVGAQDIGVFPAGGTATTSTTVTGLPTNSSLVYVRLWSQTGGNWYSSDYVYTAAGGATMISPVNASILAGTSDTFTWSNTGASLYSVWIGTTPGAQDIGVFPSAAGTTATTTVVSGLPANGSIVYVRLWSQYGSVWYFNDYTYTATGPAAMVSPAGGTALIGTSQTFTWNNTGAALYQIWVGTSPGAQNLGVFPAGGTATTSTNVTGLPADSSIIYVRLWSQFGANWLFNDYTYTATGSATMITPSNGTTLASTSPTFTWNNIGASLYSVWIGTTPGAQNLGVFPSAAGTTNNSTTASGLPYNGSPIYVRLWSQTGGAWSFNDYTYTATSPAAMISPVNLATLTGANQTFTWNNAGASLYSIWIGTTAGAQDLGVFPSAAGTTGTSSPVTVPANGSTINVRLWSQFGATWVFNDYTYTSNP